MKRRLPYLLLVLGLLIMAYPLAAYAVRVYQDQTSVKQFSSGGLKEKEKTEFKEAVETYNESLKEGRFNSQIEDLVVGNENKGVSHYDFLQTGEILATITIPRINEKLPIYYGATENVLRVGVGLMENTSYPGTMDGNAVLTGHRGTYDANIFRHIDKVEVDDVFYIQDKVHLMKYKVYEIKIVQPHDGRFIKLEKGRDLVTLVTCTPYLINTERLLIFAERTNFEPGELASLLDKKAEVVDEEEIHEPEIRGYIALPGNTITHEVKSMGWDMKVLLLVVAVTVFGLIIYVIGNAVCRETQKKRSI